MVVVHPHTLSHATSFMATYLVTGATGFIGSHLAGRLCQLGYHVRCLVRDPAQGETLQQLGAELCAAIFGTRPAFNEPCRAAITSFIWPG